MKNWSFKTQMLIACTIMFLGCLCAAFLGRSLPAKIACALYGLLFVIHPVHPGIWEYMDPKKRTLGIRIAGLAIMVISIFLRVEFAL